MYLCLCLKLLISLLNKPRSQVKTIKQFALSLGMGSCFHWNQSKVWTGRTSGVRLGPSASHGLWGIITGSESSWWKEGWGERFFFSLLKETQWIQPSLFLSWNLTQRTEEASQIGYFSATAKPRVWREHQVFWPLLAAVDQVCHASRFPPASPGCPGAPAPPQPEEAWEKKSRSALSLHAVLNTKI